LLRKFLLIESLSTRRKLGEVGVLGEKKKGHQDNAYRYDETVTSYPLHCSHS
jgi:hypothetical protein